MHGIIASEMLSPGVVAARRDCVGPGLKQPISTTSEWAEGAEIKPFPCLTLPAGVWMDR
jgi:hypothetical protein